MAKNYMEEMIDEFFPTVRNSYEDICDCESCCEDIKAIALNHLKTLYFVTKQGESFSRANELGIQFRVNIVEELTKAMSIVSQNPRHDHLPPFSSPKVKVLPEDKEK